MEGAASSRHRAGDGPWARVRAGLVGVLLALVLGCPPDDPIPRPLPGRPDWREPGRVGVPGGAVQVAGGNLLLRRVDLVLDTRLGPVELAYHWNGATARWRSSLELFYDGEVFVDGTGAAYAVGALADGAPIPGSAWSRLDGERVRSRGGLVHRFGPDGALEAVYWASDPWPRLELLRDGVGNGPRAVRQCTAPGVCTPVFDFERDPAGALRVAVDRAGRRVEYERDGEGRLLRVRGPVDLALGRPGTRYLYGPEGRLEGLVNAEGEQIAYRYDGSGRLIGAARVGGGDPETRLAYEGPDGKALFTTRVTDATGRVRSFRYDAERRIREVEIAAADERRTLDWEGLRPVREVDAAGRATRLTWRDDELAERVLPSGLVERFTWAPAAVNRDDPWRAPLARAEDDLGLREERSYDAEGRLIAIRDGAGDEVRLAWGGDGSLAARTLPDGTELRYREVGDHGHARVLEVRGIVHERVYDGVGNLEVGPADDGAVLPGGLLRTVYDGDRRPVRIERIGQSMLGWVAEAAAVEIDWRSDGQPRAIRRPHGDDHVFTYDALGRLQERAWIVDGTPRVTRFEWDDAGRLVAEELPNGMRREWGYDAAGRVSAHLAARDGTIEAVALRAHRAGDLEAVYDSAAGGSERFVRDAAGWIAAIEFPGGERLLLDRDLRGRVVRERYLHPDGSLLREVERAYDAAGRLVRIDAGGGASVEYRFEGGRRVEARAGNGLLRRFVHDPLTGGLASARTTDAAGGLVEETTVTRREASAGFPIRVGVETSTRRGVVAETTETYYLAPHALSPYPEAGRRVVYWTDAREVSGERFSYDALGQRRSDLDHAFETNPEGNRLLLTSAGGGIAYRYDAAGFAVERGGVAIGWSAAGRIATLGDDRFEFDLSGRPLRFVRGGMETRFLFGGRVEADSERRPRALDLGPVRVDLAGGAHRFRHLDLRGNVKFVTDPAGRVATHHVYRPYGLHETLGEPDTTAGFGGGREIAPGLWLLGARVLDSESARFLSPDPLLSLDSQYAYAFGNPLHFGDPGGLQPLRMGDIIALLLATAGTGASVVSLATLGPVAAAGTAVAAAVGFGVSGAGLAAAVAQAGLVLGTPAGDPIPSVYGGAPGHPTGGPCLAAGPGDGSPGGGGTAGAAGAVPSCSPHALAATPRPPHFSLGISVLCCLLLLLRHRRGWPR